MVDERGFDGTGFLRVAKYMNSKLKEEEFSRSAIGRCYYATFLPALTILTSRGVIQKTGRGSDHHQVKGNYGAIDRGRSKDFQRLYEWRRIADYEPKWSGAVDLEVAAQKAIEIADDLIANMPNR